MDKLLYCCHRAVYGSVYTCEGRRATLSNILDSILTSKRLAEVDMPIPFEFVIDGPPVSQQTRNSDRRKAWMKDVRSVAGQTWDAHPPVNGAVMVSITYFFEDASLDVDNIPKPILDALKGLVYDDDCQVTDLLCRKRDMNGDLRIQNPSSVLLETFQQSKQFLHISVINALNQEVAPW